MKKIFYLFPLCILALAFAACEETEAPSQFDNWRVRNELFMDSLSRAATNDPDLLSIVDERNKSQRIYLKKIVAKTQGQEPLLTSKVSVYYRGMLINEGVFAASKAKYYTSLYKQLTVFEDNFKGDAPGELDSPSEMNVGDRIAGWVEVLQRMKVGERWEVYIPAGSAYGDRASGVIPKYSTLIFDIQLEKIVEY